MATVDFFTGFTYKWAQAGDTFAWDDSQYKLGWATVGSTPPTVEQFNRVHQIADEKANWLYGQLKTVADVKGVSLSAVDLTGLEQVLAAYAPDATTSVKGIMALATQAEANAGMIANKAITPETLSVSAFQGAASVLGAKGGNNSGTPGTRMDLQALGVVFRNPSTGKLRRVGAVPSTTCDITLAGPVANGRDQIGSFSANVWLHFYFISNGTDIATISSVSGPQTGPSLPSGYTEWAYITSVRLGTILAVVTIRGKWVFYNSPPTIVAGTATTSTPVDLSAIIPPNTEKFAPVIANLALTSTSGGSYSLTGYFGTYQCGLSGTGGANAVFSTSGGSCNLPNNNQETNYYMAVQAGSGPTITILMNGYSVE